MLDENAKLMQARIDQVADPEIGTFNIAIPNKKRLPVFDQICPSINETEARQKNSKGQKKKGANKIVVKGKQTLIKKEKKQAAKTVK